MLTLEVGWEFLGDRQLFGEVYKRSRGMGRSLV